MMRTVLFLVSTLSAFPGIVAYADVNTGLLEREIGSVGDELGARVINVDRRAGGITVLDLSLPPLDEEVDRVDVLDQEGRLVEQVQPAKIDSDSNRVGVRLYLKPAPKVNFRLRLYDDSDEQDNPRN